MAKAQESHICQDCGAAYSKWQGKCDACGGWNTLQAEAVVTSLPKGLGSRKGARINLESLDSETPALTRRSTNMAELDRALGGGLVPGSAVLLGGDPGIGKSTILLQAMANLSSTGAKCVYISGEEALGQIRMRASRLGLSQAPLALGAETSLRDIIATLESDPPDVVVIDSIQTMYLDTIDSAPGTVTQVRAAAQELIRFAKRRSTAMLLVGHVTKEGTMAGPRVLEHMVDTVLYFEGERGHQFRILRAVKNRFGGTDEIGVFEMTSLGLQEVANPSALFLGDRTENVTGAAVFAGLEGTRPLLVEIQALVSPSSLGTPRRAVVGWDNNRLSMVLAVLDARCGLGFGGQDVYLNVAGGLRITEPAADLAVAAALVSALTGKPVPANTVVFGEISLAGEIRRVTQAEARLKEAAKLGFDSAWAPAFARGKKAATPASLRTTELAKLVELVELFA